jgi:hypothetical protein
MVVDVEVWILAIVPILALVALTDSATSFSSVVSRKLGISDRLWVHLAILLLSLSIMLLWLGDSFDLRLAFVAIDFLQPERHFLKIELVPVLIILDPLLVLISVLAGVVVSLTWSKNLLLCVIACLLGNVGTVVWLFANERRGYTKLR